MPETPLQKALRRAAELGPALDTATPSEPVTQTDNATLLRYGSVHDTPLLITYSLVNRPAILDLSTQRSVIARLSTAGFCVYLLAWHPPGAARRHIGLSDYVLGDIADALYWVTRQHSQMPHLLGVCQGGVLALCYAALIRPAALPPILSLTTLATPVDTQTDHDRLGQLAQAIDFNALVNATGNITGAGLASLFASLKPFALGPQRYRDLAELAEADDATLQAFMRLERWMYDGPDLAGAAFAEFAEHIYQRNALANGGFALDGHRVELANVSCPTFNAYADDDHLVPPAAAWHLADRISGTTTEMSIPGGHLGLFISQRAHRTLYPALIDWLGTLTPKAAP